MLYKNKDPNNPFKPRTLVAALYEEDFSDLTAEQIAEVFDTTKGSVQDAIYKIKRLTEKDVKVMDGRAKRYEQDRQESNNQVV